MGAIADRTKTKHGKFRPYLIWGSTPMAIATVLAFTTPDIGIGAKAVWAFVTYSLMMVFYTVLSTPYSSLSGVITGNVQERNLLVSVRFIFAFGASALIGLFTPDLIKLFGKSDAELGWQLTAAVYGTLATIIFYLTFRLTKERVAPSPK
jgi:GPH family glycoside/pentoside/hexuronide:cation symporter